MTKVYNAVGRWWLAPRYVRLVFVCRILLPGYNCSLMWIHCA